jgi:hypothetical protein
MKVLEGIQLTPVLELEPSKFSAENRKSPSGTRWDPEEWFRYWTDSLADSGITGLQPLRRGSWFVPTANFQDSNNLQRFLEKTFQHWGGIDVLSDPDCNPVLDGGLAFECPASDVLVQPGCCADLGDASNWKEAAEYRGAEWLMLWIGHPWLSVRYQSPWLVVSDQHESSTPSDRWAVLPEELDRAVDAANTELERFAGDISRILPVLGYVENSDVIGRKLAGLSE